MRPLRFLFVGPHPDDVELGLGGTIAKLKRQKNKIFVVDLTSGEPTPYGSELKRKKETLTASRILGIDERVNLNLPNRYLFDNKDARLALAEVIRKFKPHFLFAPFSLDAHPDHIAASQIATASRFYAKYTKLSLKYKPHYPYRLFYYCCAHLKANFNFSFLIDISDYFSLKRKAIAAYRSQFIDNPSGRYVFDYIQTQNRYLGNFLGKKYAEGIISPELVSYNFHLP